MMPSIGASFANSQSQKSGGQNIFSPVHSTAGSRVSQTWSGDYSDEQSSEATAKTDMGGGLFGGGGGDDGGFGLGGLVSGIGGSLSKLFGKSPAAGVGAADASVWILLGAGALVLGVLLFAMKGGK